MRIELIKQILGEDVSYKYKPFKYCCDKLKDMPYISLENEFVSNNVCNKCEIGNCDNCPNNVDDLGYKVAMMFRYDDTHPEPWEDYDTTDTYYFPIKFCPFCGEPIEVAIIKEEDKTELINNLFKQLDDLRKKCSRTDSKKREVELREQICGIDNVINELNSIGEYKEAMTYQSKLY